MIVNYPKEVMMVTLDELCTIAERSGTGSASLRQACSLPRSAVDMAPLPEPDGESAFDSSWEALLSTTPTTPAS